MSVVCPTVMASSPEDYKSQIEIATSLAQRIQIDLTDGIFATSRTIKPSEVWWPEGGDVDIHLMYQRPIAVLPELIEKKPHMIIIQAEADGKFENFVKICKKMSVKVGVAVLPTSSISSIFSSLVDIDHVMIFSGNLGEFGGKADLSLLDRVRELKAQKPELEVGWDGGVNDTNIRRMAVAGVDVLNVGGYIQNSDNPVEAFDTLQNMLSGL